MLSKMPLKAPDKTGEGLTQVVAVCLVPTAMVNRAET